MLFFSPKIQANNFTSDLGWVSVNDPNNICGGYYIEPILSAFGQPTLPFGESQTSITFDKAIYYQQQPSVLSGNVVVIQSGRRLEADKAVLYRDPNTGKVVAVDLFGNIRVVEPGRLILGDTAHIKLNQDAGIVSNVTYRVLLASDDEVARVERALADNSVEFTGTTAWGRAEKAVQVSRGKLEFAKATYTTCAPTVNQWRLNADNIKLDKAQGRGVARNVTITVKDIPIFYSPYLNFPISKKRKTGFLYPNFSHTTTSGFSLALPFYWNIAPNYDATITPRIFTKRGVLFGGLFRYLSPTTLGNLSGAFIPADQAFKKYQENAKKIVPPQKPTPTLFGLDSLLNASDNRYLIHWQNITQADQHWSSNINYTEVSDDYYFQDFGDIPAEISTNQLLRTADLSYTGDHWNFSSTLDSYETLHPINKLPLTNLYSRLPEVDIAADYPDFFSGLEFTLQNQEVYFTRDIGPLDHNIQPPRSGRLNIMPGLSWPFYRMSGYFVPTLNFQSTSYNIQDQTPGLPDNITRGLPILDIDSGLYFDRNLKVHGNDFDQTLEPRLFYLYVPYKNQNDIPIFDSAAMPFTYNSLFMTNRFSGSDRIGDANQVSLGVTTRFIDQNSGNEKFNASVGAIYYLEDRQVTVCRTPGCTDFTNGLGTASNTESISPIAAQAKYFFSPTWSANGNFAWEQKAGFDTGNFYFQYHPDSDSIFNLGYNFIRNGDKVAGLPVNSSQNNLSLGSASFAYPLTLRWSTVGLWNYDLSKNRSQAYLAGLQYNTCCWAARVVGGRTFTQLDQNGNPSYKNGVYLQLELKGLANFDPMNASSLLTSQIPGYVDPFLANQGLS